MRRRSNLLVSDEVQLSLLMRVTLHWALFLVANCAALVIWLTLFDMPTASNAERLKEFLRICIPMLICSLLVVPLFIYDISKLSNQFAGPVLKMRRSLTAFIEGGKVELIQLRRGDFWQKFASDFNTLISRKSTDATNIQSTPDAENAYPEGK